MNVYKFFTNLEKEENWLNEMAGRGCLLAEKKLYGYRFERDGSSSPAKIRMDYRSFKKREDFEDYKALFEDSGWEHVAGTKSSGYQYFRRADPLGSEEIFSDAASKAGRYKRLMDMWVTLACCFIPIMAALISTEAIDPAVFQNPKLLYYTPGLWERSGGDFWRAFLFETPFALLRGLVWTVFPIMIILYLYFAMKAHRQHKLAKEER
ncbi:DUF2812 domain-containing protein [Paenibacillus sp. HB172176]|uniref:DUF2812 domain-containing protein n=1 Tax=Paenibacillus sp. HB172176 TaxID=2493690 RepID=UPI00143A8BD1|nr:DUF2812 domain-containing protein [Paenibacillus sp. HB172176]